MLQLNDTDDRVGMRCHYGCRFGCNKPYPVYLVVNQHTPTPDDSWDKLQPNKDKRLPMIPIPQPPKVIDFKIDGPTTENETVVL